MATQIFRRKSLDRISEDAERSTETHLKRTLGAIDLVSLGIGAIIGTGIFAVIGTAAAGGPSHVGAGPGVMLSFIITAIACGFCALCYAEFAALVPISGSAYTYSYATLGEIIAWIIGWDLIIEYAVGNVAVAIAWAAYFRQLFEGLGMHIPAWLAVDYRSAHQAAEAVAAAGGQITLDTALPFEAWQSHPTLMGVPVIFNFLAIAIVAAVTWILVIGIKESSRANNIMVALKLVILLFFIGVGSFYVKPDNWSPFMPNGFAGVWTGASLIFFAFIGFDAISTAAEECKNPGRDMPIGIIGSLVVCTVIYIATAAVLTGIEPWNQLGVADPLAAVFARLGLNWVAGIISLGAVISMTAVLLVFQLGQPRIFFSMSRDGLLPKYFAKVHPKYQTPHVTTIWTGVVVGVVSSMANINEIVELTNIGTLFAFLLVCLGIIFLRHTDPHRFRPFRMGYVPLAPLWASVLYFTVSEMVTILGSHGSFSDTVHWLLTSQAAEQLALPSIFFSIGFVGLFLNSIAAWKWYRKIPIPEVYKTDFALAGIGLCVYLMFGLPSVTWIRFGIWLFVGLVLYFTYGFWRSRLRTNRQGAGQ